MVKYEHLFFDLDRTLWDFEKNSKETISELFIEYELQTALETDFDTFYSRYKLNNERLWREYREGIIDKSQLRLLRYYETFKEFKLEDEVFAIKFNDRYVETCSSKKGLIPHSLEVLDYLKPKYKLHIITNGFVEAQEVKISKSGIAKYFNQIIVSDGLGYRKPDPRIFRHAMKLANAKSANSIMIGDDYVPDVIGAKNVGMDQIFFNKEEKGNYEATFVINSLKELKNIL
jgi:putative hydrolase of the HAD superfamily